MRCSASFTVDGSQLAWYRDRGMKEPQRCEACRRGGSTSAARKQSGRFSASMRIPQGRGSKLIGVKGATIQGLCETWGVKIAVRDGGEVMVTGKEDAVKNAMSACMVAIDMSTSSIDTI